MSEKKHPIVLRFASVYPSALSRIEMHAKRSGGPLEHVELEFIHRNKVYVGPTFAEELRGEIRKLAGKNRDEEVAALLARKRKKDAAARQERGLVDPWHGNSEGPIREMIVTAHKEYFFADDMSDADDLLTTYGIGEDGRTIVNVLSNKKIEAFEAASLEFFDTYFPGSVRHLRLDLDEEAPHFHAVIFETVEKMNKARGSQTLVQPSANPLIADYELAQDVAGEHFSRIGLVRGAKRAEATRGAKEADLPIPDSARHVSPREYRDARARAIRQKETSLREQQQDLDLRKAETFMDEIAADNARADAECAEQAALEKHDLAEEKLKAAARREAEAEAYAIAISDGLEAVLDHRLDYEAAHGEKDEHLRDGPNAFQSTAERRGLWERIRPAYARIVGFARQAFRLREMREDAHRMEAEASRRASVVAAAEQAAGRAVTPSLQAVVDGQTPSVYEAASFPGAWAIPTGPLSEETERTLDELTNRGMRDCFLATRDAEVLCEDDKHLALQFKRGRLALEFEADRRGFDLESGRHSPEAATDPKRATLHTDEDVHPIRVVRKDRQRQRRRSE